MTTGSFLSLRLSGERIRFVLRTSILIGRKYRGIASRFRLREMYSMFYYLSYLGASRGRRQTAGCGRRQTALSLWRNSRGVCVPASCRRGAHAFESGTKASCTCSIICQSIHRFFSITGKDLFDSKVKDKQNLGRVLQIWINSSVSIMKKVFVENVY